MQRKGNNMKTIADIKRELTIASVWHCMWKCRDAIKDMGQRPISIVQTNRFAFKTTKADGTITDSWCDWPKKSEVTFNSEKSFTIKDGDIELTYTKIS